MNRDTPRLETARLHLRPRTTDDAEALFPTLSDPEAMRWWSGPPMTSIAQAREDFSREAPEWRAWTVIERSSGAVIGFVAAGEKRQGGVMELGYLLAPSHWGGGFAREAVSAVIDQLFAEGNRRVFADTDPENHASRRLLERLGFRLEGVLRAEWETHIGIRDTALYGLLPHEWGRGELSG